VLRPDAPEPMYARSNTPTFVTPCFADRLYAIASPTTPPPTITTS
jgi:hypothetical protein